MATVRPAVASQAGDRTATEWDDALLFEVAVDPFQKIAAAGKEDGRAAGHRDGYLEGVGIGRSKGWEIGLELGYTHGFARSILDGYEKKDGPIGEQEHGASSADGSARQRTSHRLERCLTLARDLVKLVDEFPDPDTLLSQNRRDGEEASSNSGAKGESCDAMASTTTDGCCSADDQACSEEPSNGSCCADSSSAENPDHHRIHEAMGGLTLLQKDDKMQKHNSAVLLDVAASMERIRAKFKLLCVLLKTKQSFDLKRVLDLGKESTANGGDEIGGTSTDQSFVGRDTALKSDQRETHDDARPGEVSSGSVAGMESNLVENDW